MNINELILACRSYRKFSENHKIDKELLLELVSIARLSASIANLQPLKYILSCNTKMNKEIFPTIAWAGYLKDWPGPEKSERPSAYIVVLGDRNIKDSFSTDSGIASQSILLGAVEKGLGGCMLGSINRKVIRKCLKIPERYEIVLLIALGKPKEKVVIEDATEGNIKYYRDENGVHHVPKRTLQELVVEFD